MSHINNAHGILRIIQSIASKRESGELEIISSRNHGTLRFSKGKLVDATLGSLSGFQAVNAAVSLHDVEFSFKPLNSTLATASISPNERRVLKTFFGIEVAEPTGSVEPPIGWNTTPQKVVPLAEVDEVDQSDLEETPTLEVSPVVLSEVEEPLLETPFITNETSAESRVQLETPFIAAEPIQEMLMTPGPDPENVNAQESWLRQSDKVGQRRAEFFRRMPVAVIVLLLVSLAAAAAITLITKLKPNRELAAVPSTATQSTTPDSKQSSVPNTQHDVQQAASKAETISVAPQQSPQTVSPAGAARQRDEATHHDVQNLSGEWHVINTVSKTDYRSFQNMQIGFRLNIQQKGKNFTATGEKVSENGRVLPARSRTPIHVTGSIDGDKVVATFIEEGSLRRTNGRFTWRLQNENAALTGTFVAAAANSSGKSAATREQ